MSNLEILLILIIAAAIAYYATKRQAQSWQTSRDKTKLDSLPNYYGYFGAICTLLPALIVLSFWSFIEGNIISALVVSKFERLSALNASDLSLVMNEIKIIVESGLSEKNSNDLFYEKAAVLIERYSSVSLFLKVASVFALSILGFMYAYLKITPRFKARKKVEKTAVYLLLLSALVAILTTAGIIFSVLFESIAFFSQISIFDFVFGTHWSPQIAIREGQVSSTGGFGAFPLFWGTILISIIAMIVAAPLGLISAIYLAEYAQPKIRNVVKPILEILAGVPTVVYGFFAALTVGPMVSGFGDRLNEFGMSFEIELFAGLVVSSESALAAGLVMGMMIMPFILSLSDDVINAVPDSLRDGSIAMGSTKSETVWKVVFPAALPGIVGGFLLAISRAIGETMIVLMAAGVAANLTANPLNSVTTVTTQIVVLLTGDQEFDSIKTLSAFALALGLFVTTLILNILALQIVRRYREQYE